MDLLEVIRDYINKLVSVDGMKVLLLDAETMGMVSLVYSQSDMLSKEVYLFELLSVTGREKLAHLNAIVFVRPTDANIRALSDELRAPKYGQYHVYFSNFVRNSQLEELAQADEHELVVHVAEHFADVFALAPHLFSLNVPRIVQLARHAAWPALARRATDGILAVLLALKKRPAVRYVADSDVCAALAADVAKRIVQEAECFDFRQPRSPPLLLVLDRKDDPVTPLLQQWTYQAMVHELLGIDNNRVDLSHAAGVRADQRQVVLAADHDPFYAENMYLNFGDLGMAIKALVDTYQRKTKTTQSMESLADIKRFIEEFPEFRKLAGNTSKHVALMGELSRVVESRALLPISELEQEIANKSDHATAKTNVLDFIRRDDVSKADKLRLVVLYALRYEESSSSALGDMIEALAYGGLDTSEIRAISHVTEYAGSARRHGDLFSNKSMLNMVKKGVKRGLKGAVNVYTEHRCALAETLEQWFKGRLRAADYPSIGDSGGGGGGGGGGGSGGDGGGNDAQSDDAAASGKELIVFIVGGVTYEESLAVHTFMAANPSAKVVLGGTHVHNSCSFLSAVNESATK